MTFSKALIAVVISYFLGNISPSILISKALGDDIRNHGSGNAGTTNMLRTYGKKAAAATLLVDVLKGAAAVLLGRFLCGTDISYICGCAALIGHIWPVLYGFRGGKGIATGLGMILAINPLLGIIELAAALLTMAITKMVSPGSILAAFILPIATFKLERGFFIYALVLAIVVIYKHRTNIVKLINHEESKISFKK